MVMARTGTPVRISRADSLSAAARSPRRVVRPVVRSVVGADERCELVNRAQGRSGPATKNGRVVLPQGFDRCTPLVAADGIRTTGQAHQIETDSPP